MYLSQSIIQGLEILGFEKETIRKVSREKSLEEIFLSTLFLNYLVVLAVFFIGVSIGKIEFSGREINMPVFFGLLMIYPFVYNIIVYGVYGLFGLVAEMLNGHKKVKPLISVGFHTAIVYTLLIYFIALMSTFNASFGLLMFSLFILYFLLTMFFAIRVLYNFSQAQTLIVLFIPLLIIFTLLLGLLQFIPARTLVALFF